MGRDGDVYEASASVSEYDQDEQEATRGGPDYEEIGGHELSQVIRQERAPGLRRVAGQPATGRIAEGGTAPGRAVGDATRAPRIGVRRVSAHKRAGSEGESGRPQSSGRRVFTVGRNINSVNKNGIFSRDSVTESGFNKAWRKARVVAGCPDRIPHDFRRTAVRNLVRAGVPERVAMQLTGHKTRGVFERYNIVSSVDLRDAAQRLDVYASARV